MDSLNQIELQNLRHICGHSANFCEKIAYYKTLTEDSKVTDCLEELNTELTNLKTDLCNMI